MEDDDLIEYVRLVYLKYNLNIECYIDDNDIQVRMNFIECKYCRTFCKEDVIKSMFFPEISKLEKEIMNDIVEIRNMKLRILGIK